MKRFALLALMFLMSVPCPKSQAIILTPENVNIQTNHANMPYKQYLKFYLIDEERINIIFKQMSEEDERNFERSLSKEEKKDFYIHSISGILEEPADWIKEKGTIEI